MLLRAKHEWAQAALLSNPGAHLFATDKMSLVRSMQKYHTLAYGQHLAESSASLHQLCNYFILYRFKIILDKLHVLKLDWPCCTV